MAKLFSGNSDVIAVVVIVVTLGVSGVFNSEFGVRRELTDRIMTRVPARTLNRVPPRLRRVPFRLRLAELKHHHVTLENIVCPR